MKILVTGGSGLVGRNFVESSQALSYEIMAPSSKELDLMSIKDTKKWLKSHKIDFVVHAAGKVGGINANIKNQVDFLVANTDMARNLFTTAKEFSIKRGINLASSCIYPRFCTNPISESSLLEGGLEPTNEGYALAKIHALKLCQYLSSGGEVSYKTLVPCNLFGQYDNYEMSRSHMIPSVIRKIHEAKLRKSPYVKIWGDGTAKREFMDVADLVECMWRAVKKFETLPTLMNVGTGIDYSINEYYEMIAEVVGYDGKFEHDLSKPVGMKQKLVKTTKAREWGWESKSNIKKSLFAAYENFLKAKNDY